MSALFEAQEVNKQFANHKALDQVTIQVPENSIFGLLGPNGAGKTTLIRIINQITAPDSGQLFFQSEKLQPKHIHQIGYLPEERGLYKKMEVGEQAMYLSQLKGLSKSDAQKRLKYWFEKFEIQPWWHKKVEELSKGMQQKVQFIVTVIHEPHLIIFDEPFSGFDPINVNLLKDEILAIKERGSTIIFSTHNMASVEELCDQIALIDNSKKILEGSVKSIKQEYKSHTFELSYTDAKKELPELLGKDFEILSNVVGEDSQQARIKLLNGKDQNDLLSLILPHATIISFNEILPTMNDIFISKVKGNTNRKEQ
jgi:ABC-2 type transport system ATP-binding protein